MSKTFTNREIFGNLQEAGTSEGAKKGWQSRDRGSTEARAAAFSNSQSKYGTHTAKARKIAASKAREYRAGNKEFRQFLYGGDKKGRYKGSKTEIKRDRLIGNHRVRGSIVGHLRSLSRRAL